MRIEHNITEIAAKRPGWSTFDFPSSAARSSNDCACVNDRVLPHLLARPNDLSAALSRAVNKLCCLPVTDLTARPL
jgi:hypothetical protein